MNLISLKFNNGFYTVITLVVSVFASYFVYIITRSSIEEFFPFVFMTYFYLYCTALGKDKIHTYNCLIYMILSLYISSVFIYGMDYWNHIEFSNKALLASVGAFAFFPLVAIVNSFIGWCGKNLRSSQCLTHVKTKTVFVISFFTIFIYWLPVLISEYPGILISDSTWQFAQAAGQAELSNHHPVAHTFVIYVAQRLSMIISGAKIDANLAVATYSVIQMLIMSAIFSGVIAYAHSKKINFIYLISALMYFALFPMNSIFAIYMTKDVIFSGMVLLLTLLLVEIVRTDGKWLDRMRNQIFYLAVLIMVIMFRSNGIAISAGTCVAAVILTQQRKKNFLLLLASVFVYIVYVNVLSMGGVVQPNISESIGQPINQIANVVHNGRELDYSEVKLIENVIPVSDIKLSYNPYYSDHIKFNSKFKSDEIVKNKMQYFQLWMSLCSKYPEDCLNAMFHLNIGFWYPAVHKGSISFDLQQQKSFLEQIGGSKSVNEFYDRYIGTEVRSKVFESWLWSIGLFTMLMFFLISYLAISKLYKWLLAVCPILFGWVSLMLFAPSYCETRYAYYMFISIPLLLIVPALTQKEAQRSN